MVFCANTVLYLYQMSCKAVVEVVEAVPKDDQGVPTDQDDSNHDGSGRQEHFSQVLGLSVRRKLERPVCQEVAWETWCRSEEQSTTEFGPDCPYLHMPGTIIQVQKQLLSANVVRTSVEMS